MSSICYCIIRFVTTTILILALFLLALLGGLFNRMRGGGIVEWDVLNETYWTAHLTGRAVMAVPTAILVFLLGFNFRASIVIGVLTWTSLFIGWGTYMSVGNNVQDYTSRLGIFDWILGRPEFNWKENFFRRFLREYTGMSLRGLQWTLPAGYILYLLGYGWQYSLSGSEMGAMYALGGLFGDVKIKSSPYWSANLFGQIPTSEIIWGTTIWYFLIVTCLVELVKRRRATLDKRYRRIRIKLTSKLFLCCAHDCKNILCLPHMYQVIVVTVVLITLCSAVYYVAIDQSDLLNKMQTFTGLFIGVVSLVLFLGCSWGYNCGTWIAKRKMKRSRNAHQRPARPHPRIQQPQNQENNEDYPLLPGSDSDDEREKDPPTAAQYGAVVEEVVVANTNQGGQNIRAIGIRRHILGLQHMPQHELNVIRNEVTIIDYYWLLFETIFYLDIFAIFHCLGGLVAACTTVVTICATFVCFVWNIDTPRFLVDPTLLNNCTC